MQLLSGFSYLKCRFEYFPKEIQCILNAYEGLDNVENCWVNLKESKYHIINIKYYKYTNLRWFEEFQTMLSYLKNINLLLLIIICDLKA